MAMNFNTKSARGNNASSNNDSWKAQGFINMYLPTAGGASRKKLGAIALKESRVQEKRLLVWLAADAGNMQKLLTKVELEFNSSDDAGTTGFDLGYKPGPAIEQDDDRFKAQGYINLYLPGEDGSRKKLGAIALKDSVAQERDLLRWLVEDPSRVGVIKAKLQMEFVPVAGVAGAGFALD